MGKNASLNFVYGCSVDSWHVHCYQIRCIRNLFDMLQALVGDQLELSFH